MNQTDRKRENRKTGNRKTDNKKSNSRKIENKNRVKKSRTEKSSMNGLARTIIKIIIFAILLVFLVFACSKAYKVAYDVFADSAMVESDGTDVEVNIPENASSEEVGELLEYYGLIDDVGIFKLRCILYQAEFYEGTYTLSTDMTTEEILDELRVEPDSDES